MDPFPTAMSHDGKARRWGRDHHGETIGVADQGGLAGADQKRVAGFRAAIQIDSIAVDLMGLPQWTGDPEQARESFEIGEPLGIEWNALQGFPHRPGAHGPRCQ